MGPSSPESGRLFSSPGCDGSYCKHVVAAREGFQLWQNPGGFLRVGVPECAGNGVESAAWEVHLRESPWHLQVGGAGNGGWSESSLPLLLCVLFSAL